MQSYRAIPSPFFVCATLALFAVIAVPAQAQCYPDTLGLFFMDLQRGFSIDVTGGAVSLLEPLTVNGECADGSRMGVVRIDVPEECSKVNVLIEYQGQPSGWTANLGDSPTNNGFGGDAGSVMGNNAELQILGEQLAVYSAAKEPPVDRLANQDLALTDGAVKLMVANQTVGWGQPLSTLESHGLERLFAIPDLDSGDGRSVYFGVNRVIANSGRRGCGARRVLISFE